MTEQELKQGTPTDQAEESEPQPSTDERLSEIFSAFEEYGAAGATESQTCLFRLTGDAGGDYLLTTADGKATVEKDGSGDADITVTLPAEDLVRMADGDFDGRLAVASERIEIDGNLELAATLLGIIEPEEA